MVVSEIEFQLHSPGATWTYEMWERLPNDGNRYEIIDGVLYMATVPSLWHQRVVGNLLRDIAFPSEDRGIAIGVMAPIGVVMAGGDPVVQPDFLLIRSEHRSIIAEDGRIRGVPDLIAEILSPSHPNFDTVIKRAAYARAGVPEYWILRPESRDILVCSEPDAMLSDYTSLHRFSAGNELLSPTLPISVAVAALFEDAVSSHAPTE
ncbi:MAG: Uma2 family endonuclease [Chloroflexota bacterium]|nr:Uma2 family endonuclease [Chloroflexota bacterium]